MKPAFVASPRNGSTDLVPRSGSVFDYVSASRLTLWLRCPLAYRLKYIDGIQFRTPPAVFLGKQVHAGLEWYYRHQQFGLDLTSDDVCDFLRRDWSRSVAWGSSRPPKKQCLGHSPRRRRLRRFHHEQREPPCVR
jgi:hypothetical protein